MIALLFTLLLLVVVLAIAFWLVGYIALPPLPKNIIIGIIALIGLILLFQITFGAHRLPL